MVMPPFCDEFLGGRREFAVEAGSILALLRALDREGPGLAAEAEARAAVAVDGVVATDWTMPLSPGSEVLVIPRVAGG